MEYTEEEILSLLKNVAKEKMPKGTVVILFGSRARGDARKDSDWDVLILLDKEQPTFEDKDNVLNEFFDIGFKTNQFINTIIFSKKQWEESYFTPFYKNVEQDGIIL